VSEFSAKVSKAVGISKIADFISFKVLSNKRNLNLK
jgi:hypothetical protein